VLKNEFPDLHGAAILSATVSDNQHFQQQRTVKLIKMVDLSAQPWHYAPEAYTVENFLGRLALFFSSYTNNTRPERSCFDLNIEARAVRRERKGPLYEEAIYV
jgi:hypothetical protein